MLSCEIVEVRRVLNGVGRFQVVTGDVQVISRGFENEDAGKNFPKSELTGHGDEFKLTCDRCRER
jgi:hypothetical protein